MPEGADPLRPLEPGAPPSSAPICRSSGAILPGDPRRVRSTQRRTTRRGPSATPAARASTETCYRETLGYPPRGGNQRGRTGSCRAAESRARDARGDRGDRTLLQDLTVEERARLLAAAGSVFDPDVVARRRAAKELRRRKKNAKLAEDESLLADTGIRMLREKPVFTTPNVFPPDGLRADRRRRRRRVPRGRRAAALLRLQAALRRRCTSSTISSARPCGDFNFAKRTELADLSGRVALLTGGRVKIGYQAGLKLLRAARS